MLFLWFKLTLPHFSGIHAIVSSKIQHRKNNDLPIGFWLVNVKNSARAESMKILVVHRQKMVVDQVKSVLQGNSPVVTHTDSGLDGLLTSRIETFDLIICGTDLPVITGFELVRSIRTNSVNKTVPVIFLADQLDAKTEHLGNALGVAGMLAVQDVDDQLAGIVQDQVKPESVKNWNSISGVNCN